MRYVGKGISLLSITLVLIAFNHAQNGVAVGNNGKGLTQQEQDIFLSSRVPGLMDGTFSSYGSLLFALKGVAIHTYSDGIGNTTLGSPFPVFYSPTWRELFDSIAQQTRSHLKYDASKNYWVFYEIPTLNSYTISLSEGWKSKDEGIYIKYTPPTYPVGMDIYRMGSYSAATPGEETKIFDKVRDSLAVRFASPFNKTISVKEMTTEQIDGVAALYFEAESPIRKNVVWRQWVFVSKGKAFVIVSTLDKGDTKLFKDVKGMVASFKAR